MNEYTYEIWESYDRKITGRGWSDFEFHSLQAIKADDATNALVLAKHKLSRDERYQYQVRNLKKI